MRCEGRKGRLNVMGERRSDRETEGKREEMEGARLKAEDRMGGGMERGRSGGSEENN